MESLRVAVDKRKVSGMGAGKTGGIILAAISSLTFGFVPFFSVTLMDAGFSAGRGPAHAQVLPRPEGCLASAADRQLLLCPDRHQPADSLREHRQRSSLYDSLHVPALRGRRHDDGLPRTPLLGPPGSRSVPSYSPWSEPAFWQEATSGSRTAMSPPAFSGPRSRS